MDAIDTSRLPGVGPLPKKKSPFASARELIAKHKKSSIAICAALIIIAVLVVVCVYNAQGDGFVSKYIPWSSPDVKLLKKNHTDDTKRSDNKVDNWSKDDYVAAVNKFNSIASST